MMSDHRYNPEKTLRAGYIQELQATIAHRGAQLAEVTRQRDELVEAVTASCPADDSGRVTVDTKRLADALTLSALIQSGQPKGEWIDIAADGSNLPEPIVGNRYRIALRSTGSISLWMEADKLEAFFNADGYDMPVAFYSIPHIDRRPDIPAYQPKEQRDEQ